MQTPGSGPPKTPREKDPGPGRCLLTLNRTFPFFPPPTSASPVAQRVKHLPAMQEIWVQSLGWEDPLGEGNGNPLQYSCLENPMDRRAWWATVHGVARVRHD